MSQYVLDESFVAGADLGANLIITQNSSTGVVAPATGGTATLIGATDQAFTYNSGQTPNVSVRTLGNVDIIAGGAIAYGDPITSDANGHAIKATGTAGTSVFIVGFARENTATSGSGEVVSVHIAPGHYTF